MYMNHFAHFHIFAVVTRRNAEPSRKPRAYSPSRPGGGDPPATLRGGSASLPGARASLLSGYFCAPLAFGEKRAQLNRSGTRGHAAVGLRQVIAGRLPLPEMRHYERVDSALGGGVTRRLNSVIASCLNSAIACWCGHDYSTYEQLSDERILTE